MNQQNQHPFEPPDHAATRERAAATGSAVPYVLALAVLSVMAYGGWKWWQVRQFELRRGEASLQEVSGPPLKEFELTESSGSPFRSADMRGKVWVATYFFTTCPGSCIRLNRNIQLMQAIPELKDVTWVSITCDPETDTLEALREYAQHWNADPQRWLFCRADLEYTKRVAKGMNLALFRQGHQDYAIVVDKAGKPCGWFDASSKGDCQRLRTMLVKCLAEDPQRELAAVSATEKKSG